MDKNTIIIVDDETNILNSLKRILEDDSKNILITETAENAWEIFKKEKEIEVILCDNRLPGMLGIDFLAKVKRLYPDTIRILMTGYPDVNTAMDAINKANIWRYILKPIEVKELNILVNQAFEFYQIMRENRLLLQIARQHAECLKVLKDKYPQVSIDELQKTGGYIITEKYISQMVEKFMNKYYDDKGISEK